MNSRGNQGGGVSTPALSMPAVYAPIGRFTLPPRPLDPTKDADGLVWPGNHYVRPRSAVDLAMWKGDTNVRR